MKLKATDYDKKQICLINPSNFNDIQKQREGCTAYPTAPCKCIKTKPQNGN